MTSETPEVIRRRFPDSWEARFPEGRKTRLAVQIPPFTQKAVGLKVAILPGAKLGQSIKLRFVQRNANSRQIVGGVAVQVNVVRAK